MRSPRRGAAWLRMPHRRAYPAWPIALLPLLVLLLLLLPGQPAADGRLTIGAAEGAGWRAGGISADLALARVRPALTLQVARFEWDVLPAPVTDLRLHCRGIDLAAGGAGCQRASLAFTYAGARYESTASVAWRARSRQLDVALPRFALPLGEIDLKIRLAPDGVTVALRAAALDAVAVQEWLPVERPVELSAGALALELDYARGEVSAALSMNDVAFSDASGRLAAEALGGGIRFRGRHTASGWRGTLELDLARGGVYAEPVYVDLAAYPVQAAAAVDLALSPWRADFTDILVHQAHTVTLRGSALASAASALEHATLEVTAMQFPAVYDTWFAGALVGTAAANLDTAGQATARLAWRDGNMTSLSLVLDDINVEDRDSRFALYAVNGEVNWAANGADLAASSVRIGGGYLHGAGFDATSFELGIAGEAIDLLEPARVPLLGGALVIERFSLRDYGSERLDLGLDAALEPIDLGQLTLALDWPAFSGELSGRLPLLRYHAGVLTVGGTLEARAFDGDIAIEQLRVEQPLGVVPRLGMTVRMRNLDLARVTEIVPFGHVEGRLDADIEGLRMLKGEPIAFDASFRTPPGDDSRHRLSQRAVDTISRVAGGGAALSTTFLSVFKHFAYERLGIACRLENDVCIMDGVGDIDGGYYIVKGAWIPRVDLIGRVRQVRWSRLVEQLDSALNEGEFTVD